MTLSREDGQLYYKLWLPLLDYVNKIYNINSKIKRMADEESLNPNEVKEIADKMWDDVSVIDGYLEKCSGALEDEHVDIIRSWKRRIRGQFVLERNLKKGSIFISMDNQRVYQVCGIISSWEEMFPYAPLPIMMEATFIPFKDTIISDGLVMPYNVVIGHNMAGQLKDIYTVAKKSGMLYRTL
ncbi:hypothetical protein HNQ56_002557 [Anaerotaenia torta]|uniref:hypothetical protein n=1 Tax=Anaerotaenia torta TaxID=433293 RepID=UPI003D22F390